MSGKRKDVDLYKLAKMTGYERSTLSKWCREGKIAGARRVKGEWRVSVSKAKAIRAAVHAGRRPFDGTRLPLGAQGVGSKSRRRQQGELPLQVGADIKPPKVVDLTVHPELRREVGLSKREKLAGLALQGIMASARGGEYVTPSAVAHLAVDLAEALLEELEHRQTEKSKAHQ